MNTQELQDLFGATHISTGEPTDWEVVRPWGPPDNDDGTATHEEIVVVDKNSGDEQRCLRMKPEVAEEHARIEKIQEEARRALDEAGLDRTADGILWLQAVHEDPSLKKLEGADIQRLRKEVEKVARVRIAAEKKAANKKEQ